MTRLKKWFFWLPIMGLLLSCNLIRAASPQQSSPEVNMDAIATAAKATIASAQAEPAPAASQTSTPLDTPAIQSSPEALTASTLKVVYIKEDQIWLWEEGQVSRMLSANGPVFTLSLSPDGQIVAYLRQVDEMHTELWAINTDGSSERRLVSSADLDALNAAVRDPSAIAVAPYRFEWVPGSHTLAFNTQQTFEGPGLFLFDDLHLVDADALTLTTLLPAGQGGDFYYSPDGKQIAITTFNTFYLMNADGSNRRQMLTYQPVITYSEYRYYAEPVWAQDSSELRLALPPADPLAEARQPTAIWRIPANGEAAQQIGSVPAAPFFMQPVVFSPDFSHLLYLAETGEPAQNLSELYIANGDGQGAWVYQQLSFAQTLTWSPDGQQFTYVTGDPRQAYLGQLEAPVQILGDQTTGVFNLRWVDNYRYLLAREVNGSFEFTLSAPGYLDMPSVLIDTISAPPPTFDFAH